MKGSIKNKVSIVFALVIGCLLLCTNSHAILTANDILQLPFTEADYRLNYGNEPRQFGDLRLPKTQGPYPVVIIIHGGCWLSKMANLNFMAPVAQALTQKGYATWNIEYRAADSPGGGWPGTFLDVSNAIDYLQVIALKYNLDLNKVVILGHSAGGHLALWGGARHKLPLNSEIRSQTILPVRGIIDLAGPGDLKSYIPWGEKICKNNQIFRYLLGDNPQLAEQRMKEASPYELLPLGVKQIVIIGDTDRGVMPSFGEAYVQAAQNKGDDATFILAKEAGHYEVIAPGSHVWPMVELAINALLSE